jgi:hypothetical protein
MQDGQNTATGGANAGRLTGIAGNIDHDHGGNTGGGGTHTHTITGVSGSGGKTGANHVVPFIGLNFIIKT